jgi:RNA methyltransferase, TrmH family
MIETWPAQQPDMLLLEGFHAVKHAMRFGAELGPIITTSREALLVLAASHAPDLAERLRVQAREVDSDTFQALVGRSHPTGTAALARRPAYTSPVRHAPTVLLDHPRNLGNVGAVIRVAAGMDAAGVLTVGELDPWHPTVLRGSAGLHFALPVLRLASLDEVAGPVIGLDAGGEDIRTATVPDDAVLAFGSERHGLSADLRARADCLLALPMRPGVSSYNLATSVGMTLYQWKVRPAPVRSRRGSR